MTQTCFHNHTDWVFKHLQQAKYCISIAMCWFSNPRIFQLLLEKIQNGVAVELVLEFDDNNIRAGGLNFDQFIQSGGKFYAAHETSLMHHKFAVIDNNLLLTGSFNWTNNTNAENTIALNDGNVVHAYLQEFMDLKNRATQLQRTSELTAKISSGTIDSGQDMWHDKLRKKIASGNKCWVVKLDKTQIKDPFFFQKSHFPFDPSQLSHPYWIHNTQFLSTHFENWLNSQPFSIVQIRYLNTWYRRIRPGDILLPIGPKNKLLGLGVIQPGHPNGPQRKVIWIQTAIPQINLHGQYPTGAPVQYLGSGMKLLQTLFSNQP